MQWNDDGMRLIEEARLTVNIRSASTKRNHHGRARVSSLARTASTREPFRCARLQRHHYFRELTKAFQCTSRRCGRARSCSMLRQDNTIVSHFRLLCEGLCIEGSLCIVGVIMVGGIDDRTEPPADNNSVSTRDKHISFRSLLSDTASLRSISIKEIHLDRRFSGG